MKVKDLPTALQPRETLLRYGVENLSDIDLLSILFRTGTKDSNVKEVSKNLIESIGSLNNLGQMGIREISKIKGIGTIKAMTILASIELGKRVLNKEIEANMALPTSVAIHEAFKRFFLNENQEKVLAIFLDNKKRLISYKTIFIGTVNKSLINPREIYNEALKAQAVSLVIMHNHPSGDITPSKEDNIATNQIKECGDIIGIPLLDHIITNGKEYYSYYDKFYKK